MILAIDQGTTGTTCFVYDDSLEPIARAHREFTQHFPQPGWVEHDPREIWSVTQAVIGEVLADTGVRPGDLTAVGIANQRETVCVWDPSTGEPLHNAIVWQDRRTAARCEELRAAGHEPLIRARTGLVLDPYFSATKIAWLLEHVPGLRERADAGTAVFGTIDSWLIFKLTGGEHLTDASNASRTLLYDITAGRWDEELLDLFEIPARTLPVVRPSAGVFGETRPDVLHGHAVPIAGVAGDQQAALFGQACVDPGMAKATFGTGSFVLLHSGFTVPDPGPGLLATVASQIGSPSSRDPFSPASSTGESPAPGLSYALEASIFVTGAAVQWLRDELQIIERAEETAALAASLDANDGVYFVPALTGLGSPHWDPHARGTIVGLTRGAGRAHLARATLEAIAYQTLDAVRAMEAASGRVLSELRADGGASANDWLMQFQADVLGVPVVLGESSETTALGAAYLAGVGVGRWTVSDVRESFRERERYEPRMGEDERAGLLAGWADALARTRNLPGPTR
jgi:glycerol kinase